MIVTSALDRNGAALTFGLITAVAILCLMVATAVSPTTTDSSDRAGEQLEEAMQALVQRGADERAVRDLVRQAVRFGRRDRPAGAQVASRDADIERE
jgi:hypothetical protein